ncbi:hypothetical protein AB6F13_01360 [Staphylococcus saprophyticus]|uniref:hypothetical protein n=1 Tax=Staphylococcus saprophyticus TaxID=29385 RepID=UPI002972C4FB|nr:hypothetical protein [Staphylococcus saprophyticus]
MGIKQVLKITLLIVILAEEIKSAIKSNYKVKVTIDSSELVKNIDNLKSELQSFE